METLAQNQERHPVYVEIVAASWTPAECGKERGYDQEDYPDAEHSPHGSVGGRKMIGDQQGGDIYEHGTEKIFAASPCCLQDTQVRHLVDRTVIHSFLQRCH